jgi:Uma2 family endonuclease
MIESPQSLSSAVIAAAPAEPAWTLWRWTVEKYHEMVRAGIIDEDDPIELLDGLIIKKMTKSPRHRLVAQLLRAALERHIPLGSHVDSQDPVTLSTSEPEPDATLVRGEPRDYADRHPGAGDVALLAEVADSSLSRDRGLKKSIYALAGIAVYWIVNLVDERIEVYSHPSASPSGADYAPVEVYGIEDRVPLVLDGRKVAEIPVHEILR